MKLVARLLSASQGEIVTGIELRPIRRLVRKYQLSRMAAESAGIAGASKQAPAQPIAFHLVRL